MYDIGSQHIIQIASLIVRFLLIVVEPPAKNICHSAVDGFDLIDQFVLRCDEQRLLIHDVVQRVRSEHLLSLEVGLQQNADKTEVENCCGQSPREDQHIVGCTGDQGLNLSRGLTKEYGEHYEWNVSEVEAYVIEDKVCDIYEEIDHK